MQARRLPARHGFLWLIASFKIFRSNPPLMTALTMGYMFVVVAVNLLPLIGPFLLPLALPTLIILLANGCRAIQRGGGVGGVALTFGIQKRRIELVHLGGLQLLGSITIYLLNTHFGVTDDSMSDQEKLTAMLQLLVIAMPVVAAFWFAPLLTVWDEVSPTKAVFFSFVASWRNWRAFAMYGLTAGLIAIVIPGTLSIAVRALGEAFGKGLSIAVSMLLIFVVAPVMMASVFVSYQDVFHGEAAGE
jgi:hypothetical protein